MSTESCRKLTENCVRAEKPEKDRKTRRPPVCPSVRRRRASVRRAAVRRGPGAISRTGPAERRTAECREAGNGMQSGGTAFPPVRGPVPERKRQPGFPRACGSFPRDGRTGGVLPINKSGRKGAPAGGPPGSPPGNPPGSPPAFPQSDRTRTGDPPAFRPAPRTGRKTRGKRGKSGERARNRENRPETGSTEAENSPETAEKQICALCLSVEKSDEFLCRKHNSGEALSRGFHAALKMITLVTVNMNYKTGNSTPRNGKKVPETNIK